jgi:circadian clock protein KaiC
VRTDLQGRSMASTHGRTEPMSAPADVAAGLALPKAPTGIGGLDEITRGGLPQGRATLVTGGTGSGKTLLGVQFLVAGAREYGEPGVLVTLRSRQRR